MGASKAQAWHAESEISAIGLWLGPSRVSEKLAPKRNSASGALRLLQVRISEAADSGLLVKRDSRTGVGLFSSESASFRVPPVPAGLPADAAKPNTLDRGRGAATPLTLRLAGHPIESHAGPDIARRATISTGSFHPCPCMIGCRNRLMLVLVGAA